MQRASYLYPIFAVFCLLVLNACSTRQAPAPYTHYGASGGATSAGVHTVSSGDTVYNISQRYRIAMKDIIVVNRLRAPYMLNIGQRLTLPPPQKYEVKPGDTLYGISRTFEVSLTDLARQNNLAPPYTIDSGQQLRLPNASRRYVSVAPDSKPVKITNYSANTQSGKILNTPKSAGGKMMWPVSGQVISAYGPKKSGLHNDGINIKAPRGAPVRASDNGVVAYVGNELEGFGYLVLIRHANKWMTAYAHMDNVNIKKGQTVKQGDVIGTVGSTGSVSSPQLHFEIRRGTKALDPVRYLGKHAA
jgi:murein DD-endopeptidase MepM/ murein hydrolase activator NlpD